MLASPAGTTIVLTPLAGSATSTLFADEPAGLSGPVLPVVTVPEKAFSALPALLVATTVKLYAPPAVGVPETTPVEASRFSPAGSAPPFLTDQVIGAVPSAVSVCENAVPTTRPSTAPLTVVGAVAVGPELCDHVH